MQDLNTLAQQIHENAKAKGFWDEPRNTGEVFMLIVSELGKALEAHRSGKRASLAEINESISRGWAWEDSPLSFEHMFKQDIKDSFEDEISDVVIRILDWCAFNNIEISYEDLEDLECGSMVENVGEHLMSITGSIFYACVSAQSLDFNPDQLEDAGSLKLEICEAMAKLFCLSENIGFNLTRHIELKMQYNATRERLHGKKY